MGTKHWKQAFCFAAPIRLATLDSFPTGEAKTLACARRLTGVEMRGLGLKKGSDGRRCLLVLN